MLSRQSGHDTPSSGFARHSDVNRSSGAHPAHCSSTTDTTASRSRARRLGRPWTRARRCAATGEIQPSPRRVRWRDHRRDDFAAAALRDVLHRARQPPRPPGRLHREPERRLASSPANGSHGHRRERNGRAAYVAAVFRGLVDVVRKGASAQSKPDRQSQARFRSRSAGQRRRLNRK